MPSAGPTTPQQYPKTSYGFYLAATVSIAICLEAIIYLMMLGNTLGPFTVFRKEKAIDQALVRDINVAILRGAFSAKLYAENPQSYDGPERLWERVLKHEGIPYRVISDGVLAHNLGDASVLILPGAACLDEDERKAINSFLAEGKGVIASGPMGTRDADCNWVGWDFLNKLTGGHEASTLTPETNVNVTFRGQQFFSQKIPSGLKLVLPSQELTVLTTGEPDAYQSDWMLRPVGGKPITSEALALHHMIATGRVVWFGFSSVLPAEQEIDQAKINHYLTSSVFWAARRPLAILGNWPDKKESATLVAFEFHQNLANAQSLLSLLKSEDVSATFFCTSGVAVNKPDILKDFQSVGEIASLGISGEPLQGMQPHAQADRLHQSKLDLQRVSSRSVVGYAPPESMSDAGTITALNDAGYRYELNEMAVTSAVPEIVDFTSSVFFPFQKAEVSKIFRASSDDYTVLANYHGTEPPDASLAESFLADFKRIDYLGGVYTLYIHSYLMGKPEYYGTLRNVLDHIHRDQPVWVTTGHELVDWWTARDKVEVQTVKVSAHRISLDVANKGQTDIENISVYVYLPYHPTKVQIDAIVFHLRSPKFQMLDNDDVLRVDFSSLSAQTNYTYLIKMDE